ncbi:unnamed protein product, partial [Ixodes persulcatus]
TCSNSDLRALLCRGDAAEKLSQLLLDRIWADGGRGQTSEPAQSAAAVSRGSISDSLRRFARPHLMAVSSQFCLATDCFNSAADTRSNT